MQFFPKKFIPLPPSPSMSGIQCTNIKLMCGQFLNFRAVTSALFGSVFSLV